MANVTRIKAQDPHKPKNEPSDHPQTPPVKPASSSVAPTDKHHKTPKHTKTAQPKKPLPKWLAVITWPFRMLAKPFIALGRYIHHAWLEVRQVRWPNRKATWQMVLAIFAYTAIFIIFIMLLDALFKWLFSSIIKLS